MLNIDGIKLYGNTDFSKYTTCISFNYKSFDPAEVSYFLECNGVKTRSGLHCAPLAHKSIESYPGGTEDLVLAILIQKKKLIIHYQY